MRYIYPDLMRQYNTYIKNTDRKSLREFGLTVKELKEIPEEERTERQKEFLHYYDIRMPVSLNNSVMNRICRKFEDRFDTITARMPAGKNFDYSFMKSGHDYTSRRYTEIERLYKEYSHRLKKYTAAAKYDRTERAQMNHIIDSLHDEFRKECDMVCPNSAELCDIALDLCYRKANTKRFAWALCGTEIINNLLVQSGGLISYPKRNIDGEIYFDGRYFSIQTIKSEVMS